MFVIWTIESVRSGCSAENMFCKRKRKKSKFLTVSFESGAQEHDFLGDSLGTAHARLFTRVVSSKQPTGEVKPKRTSKPPSNPLRKV